MLVDFQLKISEKKLINNIIIQTYSEKRIAIFRKEASTLGNLHVYNVLLFFYISENNKNVIKFCTKLFLYICTSLGIIKYFVFLCFRSLEYVKRNTISS